MTWQSNFYVTKQLQLILKTIILGSIFIKKIIKLNFKKKNRNWFKPTNFGSVCFMNKNRFKPVWLGFFIWLGFSSLTRFFPVFFRFRFSSVRFFRLQVYKTETKSVGFFKILIGFFHSSIFLIIFLSDFLDLISFFNFFTYP